MRLNVLLIGILHVEFQRFVVVVRDCVQLFKARIVSLNPVDGDPLFCHLQIFHHNSHRVFARRPVGTGTFAYQVLASLEAHPCGVETTAHNPGDQRAVNVTL